MFNAFYTTVSYCLSSEYNRCRNYFQISQKVPRQVAKDCSGIIYFNNFGRLQFNWITTVLKEDRSCIDLI